MQNRKTMYDKEIYHAIFEPDASNPASAMPERLSAVHPLKVYDNLPSLYEDCEAVQRKVLEEILTRAQGTAYAADHDLNGVYTLEAWRNVAKATLYADYQPYVEREMEGHIGQLYNAETALLSFFTAFRMTGIFGVNHNIPPNLKRCCPAKCRSVAKGT